MATEDRLLYLRERSCSRKKKHKSEGAAINLAASMAASHRQQWGVYKCRFCGFWHIGRSDRLPTVTGESDG